jgi:hypothetical protein
MVGPDDTAAGAPLEIEHRAVLAHSVAGHPGQSEAARLHEGIET